MASQAPETTGSRNGRWPEAKKLEHADVEGSVASTERTDGPRASALRCLRPVGGRKWVPGLRWPIRRNWPPGGVDPAMKLVLFRPIRPPADDGGGTLVQGRQSNNWKLKYLFFS